MKNSAVLVIDVQRALCEGKYAMAEADAVIGRINGVLAKARAAGLPVVMVQHEAPDGMLDHGSPGWELARGLQAEPGDHLVRKTSPDSFHKTDLQSQLQSLEADHLIVCGFQSEFCVDTTVRAALRLGYPVTLLADGHSTLDNGVLSAADISRHHNETLANIESFGPRVTLKAAADIVFPQSVYGHLT